LSSTTEPTSNKGQVLVLFAGSLVVLFLVAALAFDVGMTLLERRDEQNAADAAALAGARYVRTSANYNGSCATPGTNAAVIAACDMALANDFDNAATDEDVFVRIPPMSGEFRALPGHIQVDISASRQSIFAGVIGIGSWAVGATAVAANQPGVHYSFGMLALSPDACKAIQISGTGTVNSAASVQSNSDGSGCPPPSVIGLSRTGGGVLNVTAPDAECRSVGDIQDQGVGTMTCTKDPFSFALPDPLLNLAAPVKPALAAPMKEVISGAVVNAPLNIPDRCPGATGGNAPSETSPGTGCTLGQGGGQAGRQWILSPGLYPGGLTLKGNVTAFLLPGIYWIGGGGFDGQAGSLISVNSETDRTPATCTVGATPPCVNGGGVLIYNSFLPTKAAGPIDLGGSGVTLNLQPYDYPFGSTTIELVIFQDRTVALAGDDVTLNGSNAQAASVRGIIYVPAGDVKVNGSNSVFTMDQVIAQTFLINGSGGTVNVLREAGVDAIISNVGLVQ
jgi:hypothetical protein